MQITATTFIIFSLAIWRLSSLVANEDGPFHVFKKFRSICEKLSDNNFICKAFHLYEGLQCEWCNSLWFSFPLSMLIFERSLFNWFVVPLSASSVVILFKYIREAIERSNRIRPIAKMKEVKENEQSINHN